MKLGETLYVTNRKSWRAWLAKNHAHEKEIWLIYYKKRHPEIFQTRLRYLLKMTA